MPTDFATLRKETHAALCLACGKCSTMCPLSSSGWFSAARMVAIREPEAEFGGDDRGQSHALDACLTCGACEIRCPEGVHFIDFVRGVRGLAASGARRACPHGELLQSAARVMAGPKAPSRDFDWLDDDLEVAQEGEVALFVGCLPFYDVLFGRELGLQTVEIASAAIRLLNLVDIQPVLLSEERCCGHDLLWNGERESFEALAAANAAAFEARGVRHILTTCAECCRTWRLDYPEAAPGYRPKIQHMSEFLAERIEAGELEKRGGGAGTMTFQDPCRLGRHLGVIDAPRRVLESIADRGNGHSAESGASGFVEMDKAGLDAQCCGTSGFIHCDANSKRLQSERLRSAAATGADRLVTACPKCLIHFRCAQSEDRLRRRESPDIEVEDLTVLAASRLGRPEPREAKTAAPKTGGGIL